MNRSNPVLLVRGHRILVLHHGLVREIGTHEELIKKGGIYYTLHELQFQDGSVADELIGELAEEDEVPVTWSDDVQAEADREKNGEPIDTSNPIGPR